MHQKLSVALLNPFSSRNRPITTSRASLVLVVLAVSCLASASARSASAADRSSGARATRTRLPLALLLVSRQDGKVGKALADAVSGQLTSLRVRFRAIWIDSLPDRLADQVRSASQAAQKSSARAVFWADLREGRHIFVYLTNQSGSKVLVRTISPRTTNRADRILATALVVESSVRALLSGGRIGLHRRATPAPMPKMEPQSQWLELSMAYGLMPLSKEAATVNGARLQVSVQILTFMRAYLAYRLLRDAAVTTEDIRLTLRSHPMEAGIWFQWPLGTFSIAGASGIWADYVTWNVQPMRVDVWAVPPDNRWNVGASLLSRFAVIVLPGASIFVDLGLDVAFLPRRYTSRIAGRTNTVTDPWPARPWFAVGISLAPF